MKIQVNEKLFKTGITVFYWKPPDIFWEITDWVTGRSLTNMDFNPCIWLRNKDLCTLVHELVHCVADIHRKKWIPQNEDTEEVFAYMMDYFFKEIFTRLDKVPEEHFKF